MVDRVIVRGPWLLIREDSRKIIETLLLELSRLQKLQFNGTMLDTESEALALSLPGPDSTPRVLLRNERVECM